VPPTEPTYMAGGGCLPVALRPLYHTPEEEAMSKMSVRVKASPRVEVYLPGADGYVILTEAQARELDGLLRKALHEIEGPQMP
jgi:hypothetical protein